MGIILITWKPLPVTPPGEIGAYLLFPITLVAFLLSVRQANSDSTELSDKEFILTILLCFFVGMIGVHRFYAGKIATGVAMIFTLGGLGIWVLVDFIMICTNSFRDINGRIIKYHRTAVVKSE